MEQYVLCKELFSADLNAAAAVGSDLHLSADAVDKFSAGAIKESIADVSRLTRRSRLSTSDERSRAAFENAGFKHLSSRGACM